MTRKDYVLIANTFSLTLETEPSCFNVLKEMAENLCFGLQVDNPRFDRARFMAACGFEEE